MSFPHFLSVILITLLVSTTSSNGDLSSNKDQTFNIKHESFFNPKLPPPRTLSSNKKFEGSSDLVDLRYHMGPVLSSSPINIYLIWYGNWSAPQQLLIKEFIQSISSPAEPSPSVAEWWRTVSLYTDQTGANVSKSLFIAGEYSNKVYSHRNQLTRISIQQVIATTVKSASFPLDHENGIYLILTSHNVAVQEKIFATPQVASTTSPSPSPPWWATPCRTCGYGTPGGSTRRYALTPSQSPVT